MQIIEDIKGTPVFRLEPPPVYFLHIQKTAGSSLTQLLFSAYAAHQSAFIARFNIGQLTPSDLGRLRCVSSHLGSALFPYLPQKNLQKITVLRDPVERVVSFIHYRRARIQEDPDKFDAEFIEKYRPYMKADLSTWLDMFETNGDDILVNGQANHLAGMGDPHACFLDGDVGRLRRPLPVNWLKRLVIQEMPAGVLAERAHRQLEQMAVVGVTENFAESVELVCDLLGVPPPRDLPVVNVGRQRTGGLHARYRATTPPDVIARIEAMTTIDCELYAHARELFAQQHARLRARRRRTISIAPRLRMPIRRARRAVGRIKRAMGL